MKYIFVLTASAVFCLAIFFFMVDAIPSVVIATLSMLLCVKSAIELDMNDQDM